MLPRETALFDVLTRFARTMSDPFDVADVLYNLTDSAVEVLGTTSAGVSLADDGILRFVSANSEVAVELEQVQQKFAQGPCHQAFTTSEPVVVDDISVHDEWEEYRRAALAGGVHAVMGIPMTNGDLTLGALNVYDGGVREWNDDDVHVARVLAEIATGYLLHASRFDEVTRVNEQLQQALDTRVVIEQAKGILAGETGIGLDAAFEAIRGHARSHRLGLHAVAESVVRQGLRPTHDVET